MRQSGTRPRLMARSVSPKGSRRREHSGWTLGGNRYCLLVVANTWSALPSLDSITGSRPQCPRGRLSSFGVSTPAPWPPTQRRLVDQLPGHRPPLLSATPSPAALPKLATSASSSPQGPSYSLKAIGLGCICLCVSKVAKSAKTRDGWSGQDVDTTDLITFIRVLFCGCVWFCFACTAGWYDKFKTGFLIAHVERNICLCNSLRP